MPQTTLDIIARRQGDLVHFTIQRGVESVTSTVDYGKFDTPAKVADWAINQVFKTVDTPDIQKRIMATIHQEIDANGNPYWVLDSIDSVQSLPRDAGKTGIESLPGWATWSAQEASDWIDVNVTDLDSAKIAMQNMAKMLVWLRQVVTGK